MAVLPILLFIIGIALIASVYRGVVIVPQSEKYVVERLGRYKETLSPGLNFTIPWIEQVRERVSILERPLTELRQDAITKDNVVLECTMTVFYLVNQPEDLVYRIKDVDKALATTISGIVRSEIGKIDLDQVQSRRSELNDKIKLELAGATADWGVTITRAEVLGINLDENTRQAMMQQIAAERQRRADVTRAEGKRRSTELNADAELYAARRAAEAVKLTAEADAAANRIVADAISTHGTQALEFEIRKRQVSALEKLGDGEGSRLVVVPSDLADAFGGAAKLFTKS